MIRRTDYISSQGVRVRQSVFTGEDGEKEVHLLLTTERGEDTAKYLLSTVDELAREEGVKLVFCRCMVRDARVQGPEIEKAMGSRRECALSIVEQPPADGSGMAIWAYLSTAEVEKVGAMVVAKHKNYVQYWAVRMTCEGKCPHCQTAGIFDEYVRMLQTAGLSLEENCQRTWLFVDDIDENYSGMVTGRNEVFDREGLTMDTHYVASTGIAGGSGMTGRKVMMDAVAYDLQKECVSYLYASSHMNRTSDYGVRFERGTVLALPRARQVFVSGTASIDDKGQVVNVADVCMQAERMMENVETLLKEAKVTTRDVQQAIVYLRNGEDYKRVEEFMARRYSELPHVVVCAPVCRPDWLVEIECMAMV